MECPTCFGKGYIRFSYKVTEKAIECPVCKGKGDVQEFKEHHLERYRKKIGKMILNKKASVVKKYSKNKCKRCKEFDSIIIEEISDILDCVLEEMKYI